MSDKYVQCFAKDCWISRVHRWYLLMAVDDITEYNAQNQRYARLSSNIEWWQFNLQELIHDELKALCQKRQ